MAPRRHLVENISPPTVCVVGLPGVGKSSLISALSGDFLSVTQGDEGTTTVPVHVESTNRQDYHVQVRCISIQAWHTIRDEILGTPEADRCDSDKEMLRAIYPDNNYENDPPDLCQFVERDFQTTEEVYDFLLAYAARENYLGDNGFEFGVLYWPVVEKVTIRGDFAGRGIPHGVSIVDLPGFEQEGPRQRIVERYLVTATTIWFLCKRDAFKANPTVTNMIQGLFGNNIRGDQNPRMIVTHVDPRNFRNFQGERILNELGIPLATPITPLTFYRGVVIEESVDSFQELVHSLADTGEMFLNEINQLVNMIRGEFEHAEAIENAIANSYDIDFNGGIEYNILHRYSRAQLGQVPRYGGITRRVNVPQDIWQQYNEACNPARFAQPLMGVAVLLPGINVVRYIRQMLFDYPDQRLLPVWRRTLNSLYENSLEFTPSDCVIQSAGRIVEHCVEDFPLFWEERLENLRNDIAILRDRTEIENLLQ